MAYRTNTNLSLASFASFALVTIRCTTKINDAGNEDFNKLATLTVRTGACDVQTYLTADECRTLARGLLDSAADLDRIAIELEREADLDRIAIELMPVGETTEVHA